MGHGSEPQKRAEQKEMLLVVPESPATLSSPGIRFCSCVFRVFCRRCKRLTPSAALLESQAHTYMYSLTNVSSLCQATSLSFSFNLKLHV